MPQQQLEVWQQQQLLQQLLPKGSGRGRGGEEKHLNNVEANATTATLSKQTARLSSTEAATGSATASAVFAAASAAALWQRVKA